MRGQDADGAHSVKYTIKATAEAQRDPTYQRYFAPVEIQDARLLRMLLSLTCAIGRWPPGLREDPDTVNDLGFACHVVGERGRELTFFSWQASGDKGDRVPPLRVFFYFGVDGARAAAFVVHVVEESRVTAAADGVIERVAMNIRAHKARGGRK